MIRILSFIIMITLIAGCNSSNEQKKTEKVNSKPSDLSNPMTNKFSNKIVKT